MKPSKLIFDEPEKPEMAVMVPVKTEKFFERKGIQRGHTVFEIDTVGLKCRIADLSDPKLELIPKINFITRVVSGYTTQEVREIRANKHCVYIPALNKGNALKKFMQLAIKEMEAATK